MHAGLGGGNLMGGRPKPLSEIVFDKYDTDKSGSINKDEFRAMCFNLGYALSPDETDLAVKVLDSDGSGQIEKKEFTAWWAKSDRWSDVKLDEAGVAHRQKVASVFNGYDNGKTGSIQAKDYDAFFAELTSEGLTKKTKDKFLEDLDKNRDGKIQFPEYLEWLANQGSLSVQVIDTKGAQAAAAKTAAAAANAQAAKK